MGFLNEKKKRELEGVLGCPFVKEEKGGHVFTRLKAEGFCLFFV